MVRMSFVGKLTALLSLASLAALPACAAEPPDEEVSSDEAEIGKACAERNEVVVWAPSGGQQKLVEGLTKDLPCTHYYVVMPLQAGNKTSFHTNVAQELKTLHDRGTNFHAVAEFHWTSWREWIDEDKNNRNWEKAGRELRRRMDVAGFDVHLGNSDTWFIQEIPSTVVMGNDDVTAKEVRTNVIAATRGLFEGGKVSGKKGGAMRVGAGHDVTAEEMPNIPIGKQRAKAFLEDAPFWQSMDRTLRFWSDEVYVEPRHSCVSGALVGARAKAINDYAFRLVNLAEAAPDGAGGAASGAARSFLRKTYTPLLNGTFGLPQKNGYGDTQVPIASMEKFLPLEIYSAVAYARTRDTMTGTRLGFAWLPGQDPDVRSRMGAAASSALNRGLARGASFACSPTGTMGGCECATAGASLESIWGIWGSW